MLKANAEALKGGCNRCFAVCGIETVVLFVGATDSRRCCNRCFAVCGIETIFLFFDFRNTDLVQARWACSIVR
jgi:hypothetical protein